ncbi:MAG: DUF3450 domain-containing protein [Parvularculaceae bacterium]
MIKKIAFLGTAMALVATTPALAQFDRAVNESKATVAEAKKSQQRIDALDDQTNRLLGDYRANLKQFELLTRFNKSRAKEVTQQAVQLQRLQEDITNVAGLQRSMQPLMEDMVAKLEEFIAADIPFLEKERGERLARLKKRLIDDTPAPQRYRSVLEAYQIENEYGRTIEAYEGDVIGPDGTELKGVEFLKIGRLALVYKTKDDSVMRIYDRATGEFVSLPNSFLSDVKLGLRMAKEQTAPDLLAVPVPAPIDLTK